MAQSLAVLQRSDNSIMRHRDSQMATRDARSMHRVIIKQGYLKKLPNAAKLGSSFKKPERRWFIFGVISQTYPYLEYYESEECIFYSPPIRTVFLDVCLYVTRNQRTSRHNNVFTLVLRDRKLSLVADTRDMMNEWCRAIEDKLRALHIIDTIAGDNDYVSVPLTRRGRGAPTRSATVPAPHRQPIPPSPVPTHPILEALPPIHRPNPAAVDAEPVVYETLRQDASVGDSATYLSPNSAAVAAATTSRPTAPRPITLCLPGPPPENFGASSQADEEPTSSDNIASTHSKSGHHFDNRGSIRQRSLTVWQALTTSVISANEVSAIPLPEQPALVDERPLVANPRHATDFIASDNHERGNSISLLRRPAALCERDIAVPMPGSSRQRDGCSASAANVTSFPLTQVGARQPAQSPTANGMSPPPRLLHTPDEPAPPLFPRQCSMCPNPIPSPDIPPAVLRLPSYEESVFPDCPSLSFAENRSSISSEDDLEAAGCTPPEYDPPPSYVSERTLELNANTPLKLRQVRQLQEEMDSASGVRVELPKNQCYYALALVDSYDKVWIAGWNQRAYPQLQRLFHIGDQLLSINGKAVESAKAANKMLKLCADKVDAQLVIKRLPHGKVCLLKRDDTCLDMLGIQTVTGTAEISRVDPTGPAGQNGLPPQAPTIGGGGMCNWWITEVNSRPLNLYYRDGEVKQRLSAAGSHLSFVVQPSQLVLDMKRRLKTMKYFKDYLIE